MHADLDVIYAVTQSYSGDHSSRAALRLPEVLPCHPLGYAGARRCPDLDRAPRPSTIATRTTSTTARAEVNVTLITRPWQAKVPGLADPSPLPDQHLQRSGAQAKVRYVFQPEAKVASSPGRETPHLTQSSPRTRSPASRPFRQSAKRLTLRRALGCPSRPFANTRPSLTRLPLARHCSTMRRGTVRP